MKHIWQSKTKTKVLPINKGNRWIYARNKFTCYKGKENDPVGAEKRSMRSFRNTRCNLRQHLVLKRTVQ